MLTVRACTSSWLPPIALASQHLDVKTIGRGGPLRRLFKLDKWMPLLACLSTVAPRAASAASLLGMLVKGAAEFLCLRDRTLGYPISRPIRCRRVWRP